MTYSIIDFGAIDDGSFNCQYAIQKAIDTCNKGGGGRVIIPEGHFRTGSFILKSHVDLHLEQGALLEGVDDISLYMTYNELSMTSDDTDETSISASEDDMHRPSQVFIYAKDAVHVMISGTGIIDGHKKTKHDLKIPLIYFENIKHLIIRDVTFQHSLLWTTYLVGCSYVLFDSVKIFNNLELRDCDGIIPDHCKHMEIRNCYIETAHDAIVFKNAESTNQYGNTEYIKIHNCELVASNTGINFGSESVNDFKHISISRVTIKKASRGISFQLRDEGNIENISFSNLHIQSERHPSEDRWGAGEPVFMSSLKRHEESIVGRISHIKFKNINMIGENGVVIYGEENSPISHIVFNNCKLNIDTMTRNTRLNLDLRPTIQPDVIEDTSHVVKLRHTEHIKFEHFSYIVDERSQSFITKEFDIESSNIVHINHRSM